MSVQFVQIAAAGGNDYVVLYALDAAGTIWLYRSDCDDWLQLGVGRAPFIGPGIEHVAAGHSEPLAGPQQEKP